MATRNAVHSIQSEPAAYLFLLPSFLAMMIYAGLPILMTLPLAFVEWNLVSGFDGLEFVGVDHFISMWRDQWFVDSLRNTAVFAASTVVALVVLGFLLAAVLDQGIAAAQTFRTMFFIPYVVNVAAVAVIWRVLLSGRGPITGVLERVGLDVPVFLADPDWALPSLIVITVWRWIGYVIVVYVAAMRAVPAELFEAAEIDGASAFQRLMRIKLPLVSPTTMFITVTMIINSFRSFALVQIMTQGGPARSTSVLVYYIYRTGFSEYRFGYSSAMSIALFVIIALTTLLQWYGQKRWVQYA